MRALVEDLFRSPLGEEDRFAFGVFHQDRHHASSEVERDLIQLLIFLDRCLPVKVGTIQNRPVEQIFEARLEVTLKELAGHSQIQMTMRYVHPSPEHTRGAIDIFENYIRTSARLFNAHRPFYSTFRRTSTRRPLILTASVSSILPSELFKEVGPPVKCGPGIATRSLIETIVWGELTSVGSPSISSFPLDR